MALVEIAAALGGVALLDALAAQVFYRLYASERKADVVHFFQTDDDWTLALHEYRVPAGVRPKRPVICCHGLSGNHHGFDLSPRTSLARFLAAAGHPTFTLDLRGAGMSEHGGIGRRKPLRWRLSDHYDHDAPAAVAKVRELTGAKTVHWIGHSMGGMIAYAFLQTPLAKQIDRVVILASPAKFDFFGRIDRARVVLKLMPGVPIKTLTGSLAPLMESWRWLQNVSGNLALLPGHYAMSAANLQGQTPSLLMDNFAEFVRRGEYVSDTGRSLLDGMGEVKTPMLFMVGDADATGIPRSVEAAYEKCGAKKKNMIHLGPSRGQKTDYGHLTIVLGPNVYDEVFPHITDWLKG
jgi:pimeloyl-ACP methyl ester carboxylesterase